MHYIWVNNGLPRCADRANQKWQQETGYLFVTMKFQFSEQKDSGENESAKGE